MNELTVIYRFLNASHSTSEVANGWVAELQPLVQWEWRTAERGHIPQGFTACHPNCLLIQQGIPR